VPRFSAAGECLGFVGSSPDITDMKRAEAALREAARRKDEFLGMLAHELRNPLGAVTNALDLLRQFGPPNPNFDWARDVIDRQVTQLARMVDDLLDVSRITRGRIELKKEPISLAVPIGLALETARPAIAARRQQLAVNLPAEPLGAEVDATRLAQVVSNLLHNASKFTPEGGRIWLDLARDGAQAVVRVRDAGRGIAPELLPHIFEVFVQGEQGSNPTRGGLGLGLAIARTLVEMHGGTLHAMSAGPECGSEFVVRLPALAELVSATAAGAVLAFDSPARRILLVDDNADFVEGLERVLAAMGHDVRSALDGPGGLALAAEFRPDVVVLDIGLPGMNGYDVARRLRTSTGMENVLLVALSGYGQAEDRQRSRAAGFDHHLVKPITGAALLAVLDRARLRGAPAERRTPELGLGD
jgi:two-component system CheB/CheR fusion protein